MSERPRDDPAEPPNSPEQASHDDDPDYWLSPDDPVNKWAREQAEQRERKKRDIDEEIARTLYGYGDELLDAEEDVSSYYAYLLPDDAPQPPDMLGLNRRTKTWKEAQTRYNDYARNYFSSHQSITEQASDMDRQSSPPTHPRAEEPSGPPSDGHSSHE
jgi:hypothetical protein